MIDYSTLWKKGNEFFEEWMGNNEMPFTDEDRMIFIAGFVKGYLFVNQTEVVYD